MTADLPPARSLEASQEPLPGCALCPRLHAFRMVNRDAFPGYVNAPVPSFGADDASLLVVGLAPGLKGANRTGRPFTGDYAGDLLYQVLIDAGLAEGSYGREPEDGLALARCRITNAVRCVPPQNKPLPAEIRTCNGFLRATIGAMPKLRAVLALGRIAHDATLRALGERPAAYPFAHGGRYHLNARSHAITSSAFRSGGNTG